MLIAKLLSNENGICRYSYKLFTNSASGIVRYDYINKVKNVEQLAEHDDLNSEYSRWRIYSAVEDSIENLPEDIVFVSH